MHSSDTVFGCALVFLFGVAAASLGWNVFVTFSGLLLLLCILAFVSKLFSWKYIVVFIFAAFAGIFYYHFYTNLETSRQKIPFNESTVFQGIVSEEPQKFENYQRLTVSLLPPNKGEVSILTNPIADFSYGDSLNIRGVIQPAQSVIEKATAAFPKIEIVDRHQGFWLKEKLIDLKLYFVHNYEKFLPREAAALLSGINFGYVADFSKDFKNQMSLSGTTHLVALSGYNITVVVVAVGCVFGLFLSRRKTFYATAIIIFLFVLMVGAGASVVRAAIMGFLALLAREIGRVYSMRNAVVLTALAMTVADPRVLVYSVGFQLSFLSLLGIVYLSPVLKKLLKLEGEGFAGWRENLATTASAQLVVMPLIIYTFGQFSLTAVIANTLILGFIPFTMFLGFFLSAVGSLYFYLGYFVAKLAELLLFYEIYIIKLFSEIRLPLTFSTNIGWFLMVIYYFGVVVLIEAKSGEKIAVVANSVTKDVKIG